MGACHAAVTTEGGALSAPGSWQPPCQRNIY